MFDDDAAGWLVPAAIFVEQAGGTNGTENGVGGRPGVAGLFDDAIEDVLESAAAAGEKAGAESVAVEGDGGGNIAEFADDPVERNPVNVGLIDVVAIGAVADLAFAGVAIVAGLGIAGDRLGVGRMIGRYARGLRGVVWRIGRFVFWVTGQGGSSMGLGFGDL